MAHSFCMMISPAGHFEETGEARSCEPHVLVTSIDFRPPRPDVEAFLYGPWSGAISKTGADIIPLVWCESFWKVDLLAAPMGKPDEVIFLVALIEHVNGNPSSVRVLAKKAVIEALNTSAGEAEETRVAKMVHAIDRSVDFSNGGPNFNSAVALVPTSEDVAHLNTEGSRRFLRSFSGYGGLYCLSFELRVAEACLRHAQKDKDFACAAE